MLDDPRLEDVSRALASRISAVAVAIDLVIDEVIIHVLGIDAGLTADPDRDDEVIAEGLDWQDETLINFGDEVLDVVLREVVRDTERCLDDIATEVDIDTTEFTALIRNDQGLGLEGPGLSLEVVGGHGKPPFAWLVAL
jgi:hypothetical protein